MASENNENCPKSPLKSENFTFEEKVCWSPTFEFDAPRYTNFCSKKFSETRRLLNKIVLNQEEDSEEVESEETNNDNVGDSKMKTGDHYNPMEVDENEDETISFNIEDYVDDSSDEIDEWFNRFHPLHEPLRPQTPPGPLISPERNSAAALSNAVFKQQSLRASPLKMDFNSDSPSKLQKSPTKLTNTSSEISSIATFTDFNTPSKGPNTRIGLRSKPARILKPTNGSSINSSPSSLIRSNFSDRISETRPKTPTLNNPNNLANSTKSSLTSSPTRTPLVRLSNASSVTLSISSLTKTFYSNPPNNNLNSPTQRNSYNSSPLSSPTKSILFNIPSSPLKMKTKFSEGTASPLRTAVGILQLDSSKDSLNDDVVLLSDKILQESRKRPIKEETEEGFRNNLNNNLIKKPLLTENAAKPKSKPRIDVELEDIKKLLSQHNSRIRPNSNNINKRKT